MLKLAAVAIVTLGMVCWHFCLENDSSKGRGGVGTSSLSDYTPQELWEKAIAAKGGREQLHGVKNILISSKAAGKLSRRGFEGVGTREEVLYVFPDRIWGWRDDRPSKFGLDVGVSDYGHRIFWKVTDTDTKPRQLDASRQGDYGPTLPQLEYLMESSWVKPLPKESKSDSFLGKKVYLVIASSGRYEAEYLLDAENFLPRRVIVRGPASDGQMIPYARVTMGEYVSVSGIQMPTRLGSNLGLGVDEIDPRITYSYQINVEYDPKIFEHPPSIEDGPEAWRPVKKR